MARLGGDEFAILFPETDQEGVRIVIQEIQLRLMESMEMNSWPVTFSIGVTTFLSSPDSHQEVIKIVDGLMYATKKNGKDGTRFSVYKE